MKSKRMIILLVIFVVVLIISLFLLFNKNKVNKISINEAENKLKEYANKYFVESIKDTVSFNSITEYESSLMDFSKMGYDILPFENIEGNKSCNLSKTKVILEVKNNELLNVKTVLSCE